MPMDRDLLRAEEVARRLGVGRSKVYELMLRGDLPVVRIGRLVRVPRHALDRWIDDRTEWRKAG
jgi:excisionase family DNA binding protein